MSTRPQGTFVRTALVGALLAAAVGAGGATIVVAQDESAPPEGSAAAEPSLTFGMILVGPQDDRGWSQAHREAGEYLEQQLGAKMIVLDKVNISDSPTLTVDQVARDMIDQGAQLVFFTSDDMKDGAALAAETYPDVPMIWASGDNAWAEGENYRPDLANLGNIMGQMEFGKMIAGCTAALASQTGSIGYVGLGPWRRAFKH